MSRRVLRILLIGAIGGLIGIGIGLLGDTAVRWALLAVPAVILSIVVDIVRLESRVDEIEKQGSGKCR